MLKRLFKIFIIEVLIVIGIIVIFHFYKSSDLKILSNFSILEKSSIISTIGEKNKIINRNSLEEHIESSLLLGEKNIIIKNKIGFKQADEVFNIIEDIIRNNPEIMYFKSAEYYNGNLTIEYSKTKEELLNHQESIKSIRKRFLDEEIKIDMTDFQKIKAAHDFIIHNSKYDDRLFSIGKIPDESHTAYGNLVLGIGVCEGYAKAMKYLLDGLKIESEIVVGQSRNQSHAWNLVNLEGEYYHIDSTWDDPIDSSGEQVLRYNYFNLTDEDISKSHSWDRVKYPRATGIKYNYFVYKNLLIDDEIQLKNQLTNILLKGKANFCGKIVGYNRDKFNLSKIIDEIVYSYNKSINLKSYSYHLDEDHGILDITFSY